MRIALALLVLAGACSSTKGKTAIATTLVVTMSATAYAAHEPDGIPFAVEAGAGTTGALLPAVLLDRIYDENDDQPPGTPGEIWQGIFAAFKDALVISSTVSVPSLATWGAGEAVEGKPDRRGAAIVGAFVGASTGLILSILVTDEHLPKWARISLSAALIGTATTLGYQLGAGGTH